MAELAETFFAASLHPARIRMMMSDEVILYMIQDSGFRISPYTVYPLPNTVTNKERMITSDSSKTSSSMVLAELKSKTHLQ